jgi:hypothetical protein
MARGKADRGLTVGKKLEIIEEADRTGLIAVTAQKYGVKTGQIRDWKKNIDRLRATDPNRLVCASTIQRGHLVFNETYAQYWVGYNKFCSNHTSFDEVKHALRITQKDVGRDGISTSYLTFFLFCLFLLLDTKCLDVHLCVVYVPRVC